MASDPVADRLIVLVLPALDADLVERWRSDLPALDRLSPGRALPRMATLPGATAHQLAVMLTTGQATQLVVPPPEAAAPEATASEATVDAWPLGQDIGWAAVPEAIPFWMLAAQAGVSTRVLWAPAPLPADPPAGLSFVSDQLPAAHDVRAATLLTPGALLRPGLQSTTVERLQGDPPWSARVWLGSGLHWLFDVSQPRPDAFRVSVGNTRVDLRVGEVTAPIVLRQGEGSTSSSVSVRMSTVSAGEGVALTVLPPGRVQSPDSPVTVPPEWADDWRRFYTPLDTTGVASAVFEGLRSGWVGADAVMRELGEQTVQRRKVLLGELGRRDARLVVAWLPSAGLASQAFMGLADSGHPSWTSELARRHGGDPKSAVARLDETIAAVRETLLPGDRLLVLSDSGVTSERLEVDLNAALKDAGALQLKPEVDVASYPLLGASIDWSQTSASAVGTGLVFLNRPRSDGHPGVSGRALKRALESVSSSLRKLSLAGKPVVARVTPGAERFPDLPEGLRPDLVVDLKPGVGWSQAMLQGRLSPQAVAPNLTGVTGGLGGINPQDAAGFAVATFGAVDEGASLLDVAPTVLRAVGVPLPANLQGRPWVLAGTAQQTPDQP